MPNLKTFKDLLVAVIVFFASMSAYAQYTVLPNAPCELACFTLDPTTGIVYAQDDGNVGGGTAFYSYDPSIGTWTAPYSNTTNGVATYTYTSGPITADCTITAAFAINTYTVTATAGAGGTLDGTTPSPITLNYYDVS